MVRNLTAVDGPGDTSTSSKWPKNPEEVVLNDMDTGALINELASLQLLPKKVDLTPHQQAAWARNPGVLAYGAFEQKEPVRIEKGTYRGTQLALTKIYDLIEQQYMSFMDVAQVEPLVPTALTRQDKCDFFVFTKGEDGYPPHLDLGLNKEWANNENDGNQRSDMSKWAIFNWYRLLQLANIMRGTLPNLFAEGTPDQGKTIAEVEDYNRKRRAGWVRKDIFDRPNVGDLKDWYSDARFSQQQFTGTNPTTITRASKDWIYHFTQAAKTSDDAEAKGVISKLSNSCPESFYVQDYSYFRTITDIDSADEIKQETKDKNGTETSPPRYGCASVCLFYLNEKGKLYPLAIVPDWRGTLRSVTIYNRELFKRTDIQTGEEKPNDKNEARVDEANDWPWRYAKTCVQCSDWFRHEVTVHLTRTHLVEESIIVSANRQFEPDHPVFRILRPHWQKTLALNGSARDTLVPSVILKIVGFSAPQALKFIQEEYRSFDFEGSYVPKDLLKRGFPPEELNEPKFHNYAYARCIKSMWTKLRSYVEDILSLHYKGANADQQVRSDKSIQKWSREMRSPDGADLRFFPAITTFEELVDCVTMCIHLASPQHTAVNYLQDYYQGFVINKPSCLFTAPPTSLESLLSYTEQDLVKALPMNHAHEWLLSSHVPYLLSFKPNEKTETLMGCIHTTWSVYHNKPSPSDEERKTTDALLRFYQALQASDDEFERYAKEKDDIKDIPYNVLETRHNAVSILI
ncbi:hypothetical protein N7517_000912 [Penicillium concentricum]|uniref:Manganese lipoxygenase n=1 Tax=Penicillium concentricum TaxID=293559 RepID=A0A9W9SR64_9EURO|nr:uncharacterized protein N7517_000912 [Penicillium concentricum]KAJ5383001.1 hypothetical protein N7517_000912 [Penicillium concentricum]